MYFFFRRATLLPAKYLTSPDSFLQKSGFALRERRLTDWGLLHGDLWQRGAAHTPGAHHSLLADNTPAAHFPNHETIPAP